MPPYTSTPTLFEAKGETGFNLTLLEKFLDGFDWNKRDIRLDGFPMMSSIWPNTIIVLSYVLLAKVIGPKIMCNRKPLKLDIFASCYNTIQFIGEFFLLPWLSINYLAEGNGWGE